MKHALLILFLILVLLTGMYLPYAHGDYDPFAVGLSSIFQFAGFASALLIPVGLIAIIKNFLNNENNKPTYPGTLAFVVLILVLLAAVLGAFISNNRFSAIIILCTGMYLFFANRKKLLGLLNRYSAAYYFIIIPLIVVGARIIFLKEIKDRSTEFAIQQCGAFIRDIETYKNKNGHYPVSLLSTIEDYKPFVSGISRFHYELKGDAYNIYFHQFSDIPGTEEIVMYNKLDEQEMTVHNQDLLRVPYHNILHGHHKVADMMIPHWKIFYFD